MSLQRALRLAEEAAHYPAVKQMTAFLESWAEFLREGHEHYVLDRDTPG